MNKEKLIDLICHPHLFFPRKYWLFEITAWFVFCWMVVIVGWFSGW